MSARDMLLGLYQTLSVHHKMMFETQNATRALVTSLAEYDPKFAAIYQKHHLANVAASAKIESETQSLIDDALQQLRENMKEQ
jgi:hypothetical protein